MFPLYNKSFKIPSFQDRATPLFIAAQNGHYKILVYLLAQGAEPDPRRTDGATPTWIAAQMGHDHIVAQLLKAGARVDAARHVSVKYKLILALMQRKNPVNLARVTYYFSSASVCRLIRKKTDESISWNRAANSDLLYVHSCV